MNLREALETLGVERVRKGMRAIYDRRDGLLACSCFVGEAFGGTVDGYRAAIGVTICGDRRPRTRLQHAANVCEQAFEDRREEGCRAALRDACVQFLAEHGDAPESVVRPLSRDTLFLLFVKQDSGPKDGLQGRIPDDLWARKEMPGRDG